MLWEYFNKFCTAYLDNILIYSSNLKEHKEHLQLVLAKLCEFDIQADVDKCEFHVTKTKYLGLIISTKRIRIDLAKIKAIRQGTSQLVCKKFACLSDSATFINSSLGISWR